MNYLRNFIDELVKLAQDDNSTAKKIGWGAGIAAGGVGTIDLRPKQNLSHSKHLGNTWLSVQQHIKPGDVIIGSNAKPNETIAWETKDFINRLKNKQYKKAMSGLDVASIVSKFGHPQFSHAAVFADQSHTAYGGGGVQPITSEMYKNPASLRKAKGVKHGTPQIGTSHFIVMRPTKQSANLINELRNNTSAQSVKQMVDRKAGEAKDYNYKQIAKAAIGDWLLPKINKNERVKTTNELASDKKLIGGMCSTTPALMSKETVGGKSTKNVLPEDYLHSNNYKVVGHIGPKPKFELSHIPFKAAKWGVRGAVGLGVGVGAYNAVRTLHHDKQ